MKMRVLTAVVWALFAATIAEASETDQYYGRDIPIRDASPVIDGRVNAAIAKAVREWKGPKNVYGLAQRVRWNVDGTLFINRISFWADGHPDIDSVDTPMKDSVYAKLLPWESFLPMFRHLSSTIAVESPTGRVFRFGADKLTHMLSVGWNYYGRFHETRSEKPGIEYGWMTEIQVLGYGTNGIFSNGDLTANYEGMRFYRSLSEDGIVPGKSAIIRWEGDRPVIQREFRIADHASEYWDESINTNWYRPSVKVRVLRKLHDYCAQYRSAPTLFDLAPEVEDELDHRYSRLMLRENKSTRVSAVCTD